MKIKTALLILAVIFAYFYFSYINIYNFIEEKKLTSPYNQNSFVLDNSSGKSFIKYVAIGDSLTAGVGSQDYKQTLVYQFALNLAKNNKVNVLNVSQSGATTKEVINNQLSQAIFNQPDYITLFIGINDLHNQTSSSDFLNNYRFILKELKSKTQAQIVIINLPYLGSKELILPPFNFILDYRTKQFNDIISSISYGDKLKIIDLYGKSYQKFAQESQLYSTDLFHPSGLGYMFWGEIINAD